MTKLSGWKTNYLQCIPAVSLAGCGREGTLDPLVSSLTTFHLLCTFSSVGKVRAGGFGSPAMHSSPTIHDLSSGGQIACISNNVLDWLSVEGSFSSGRNKQGNPGKGPR